MTLKEKNPALILIDIQQGFQEEEYWDGNRNNKNAEAVAGKILEKWRELELPVIHVRHSSRNEASPLHINKPGFEFSDHVKPLEGEPQIIKEVNSGFIGTNLKEYLDKQNIKTVVIAGITTNHCVSTTTRMAGNYGYETYLVSDASATFDRVGINGEKYDSELMHLTALASIHREFATVLESEELFKLLNK